MKTGRPLLYNERMTPYNVGLPPTMARAISAYGDGNLARGVRKLWIEHEARQERKAQRVKIEQTKAWERDWRNNPTAPMDADVVVEPGQEMLPPPSDPTTEETALVQRRFYGYANHSNQDDAPPGPCERCGQLFQDHAVITHECPADPREDSGAREAIAASRAYVPECSEKRPCGRSDCGDCIPF